RNNDLFDRFDHSYSRAIAGNHAVPAAGSDRAADVLSPGHEVQVDVRPPPRIRRGIEGLFGLVWLLRLHPTEPVGDAVDVRIDADVPQALEAENHHQVRRLPSN